jgi:MFS family permease
LPRSVAGRKLFGLSYKRILFVALASSTSPEKSDSDVHLSPDERSAAKRVVLLTVFLDILGFGIVIPQLGIYAAQFGSSPEAAGWLAAVYSVMQFLFAPFWGGLSDRIGRRPVLIWSILGTAISYAMFGWASSLAWLFASRIFAGITGANIAVAQAYLSDVTEPEERFKTFGIFGAIFGIGFAVGPLIGSLLSHLPGAWGGNLGIGVFTAALGFINWILAIKRLPETISPAARAASKQRHSAKGRQIIDVRGFKHALNMPGLNLIIGIGFFTMVAFATMQGTFTLYMIRKYVRPDVQSHIMADPRAATVEARARLTEAPKPATAVAHEGGPAADSGSINQPYSPSMGGDFRPNLAAPENGMSWRAVEKTLVQPRAAQMVGWIFTTIGIIALLVQGGLIGPLKKRFGEMPLVIVGTFMMALGLALVPLPHAFWGQFPIAALIAIGNSISAPILTALVSLLSPEAQRGEVIGVFQSTQSLGRMIGPVLGGWMFDHISNASPYWAGGAIMMVAFALALALPRVCANLNFSTTETAPAA